MKVASPLFSCAHDGKLFYKAVMKRLYAINSVSLAELCVVAKIDFSTAWRWKNGGKPCIGTINAVEKALAKLENKRAHTTSSTSGIKPIAIR